MNNVYIEILPVVVTAIAVLAIIGSCAAIVLFQRKVINQFIVMNRELTNKLMSRNFNEYAELANTLEEPPLPETPIRLPGISPESLLQEIEAGTHDIRDFPEELVGTISGPEPVAIRPPINQ